MMPMCATMGSRPLLAIAVAEEEEEEEGEGEGEGEDNATVASVSAVVEEEEEEEEELTQPSHNNSKSDLSNFGKCFWGQSWTILDESKHKACSSNTLGNPKDLQALTHRSLWTFTTGMPLTIPPPSSLWTVPWALSKASRPCRTGGGAEGAIPHHQTKDSWQCSSRSCCGHGQPVELVLGWLALIYVSTQQVTHTLAFVFHFHTYKSACLFIFTTQRISYSKVSQKTWASSLVPKLGVVGDSWAWPSPLHTLTFTLLHPHLPSQTLTCVAQWQGMLGCWDVSVAGLVEGPWDLLACSLAWHGVGCWCQCQLQGAGECRAGIHEVEACRAGACRAGGMEAGVRCSKDMPVQLVRQHLWGITLLGGQWHVTWQLSISKLWVAQKTLVGL